MAETLDIYGGDEARNKQLASLSARALHLVKELDDLARRMRELGDCSLMEGSINDLFQTLQTKAADTQITLLSPEQAVMRQAILDAFPGETGWVAFTSHLAELLDQCAYYENALLPGVTLGDAMKTMLGFSSMVFIHGTGIVNMALLRQFLAKLYPRENQNNAVLEMFSAELAMRTVKLFHNSYADPLAFLEDAFDKATNGYVQMEVGGLSLERCYQRLLHEIAGSSFFFRELLDIAEAVWPADTPILRYCLQNPQELQAALEQENAYVMALPKRLVTCLLGYPLVPPKN